MIETAYTALAEALATALVGAGFIAGPAGLEIDPTSAFEPGGDELEAVTAAALLKAETRMVRALMGGPAPRYVVERTARLELCVAGPDAAARKTLMGAALLACASLVVADPTLSGAAERVDLADQADDGLPPNGEQALLTFALRVRSGDPLGLTP